MESGEAGKVHRVLLTGFMGAGKTSVGREVARRLSWRFRDFDDEVERLAGKVVHEIFEQDGEKAFRSLEARVGEDLLNGERVVLAAGGGWAAPEGRLDAVPEGTLTVWLQVTPERVLLRCSGKGLRRPLLEGSNTLEKVRALLRERERHYRQAALWVDTEGRTIDELSAAVAERARPESLKTRES